MGQEGEESSPHSSFLTLITKLQIHSAFGVLQNIPAVIRRKIAQVVQRDPIMTKPLVTKKFERPDVSKERMAKPFERNGVSNERVTKPFERPDVSNELVIKSFERADVSTNG